MSIAGYWVYVNHTIKKARIHRAECWHCDFGAGHGAAGGRTGEWRQFGTFLDAAAYAHANGYSDDRPCFVCLPEHRDTYGG